MNKKVMKLTAFLSAACFLTTGCSSSSEAGEEESGIPAKTAVSVKKEDLSDTLSINGTVESSEKDSTVTTELYKYKVSRVLVNVGDSVKAGDVVCELDSTEIENEIAELEKIISDGGTLYDFKYQQLLKDLENAKKTAELDIKEAENSLNDVKNQYNEAKNAYDSDLSKYNSLSAEAADLKNRAVACSDPSEAAALMEQYSIRMTEVAAAMTAYETDKSKMNTLNSNVSMLEKSLETVKMNAQNQIDSVQYSIDTYSLTEKSVSENTKKLDELKKQLENTKVKATKDGVIASVLAEEGKTCSDGVLMKLQSAASMCVHIVISEEDLFSVEKGMKAVITIPARKDEEFDGEVEQIIDIKSGEGFDGFISINDTDNFRIGMTAKVKIKTVDAADVLAVKTSCIFEDNEKSYVYEAEKQSEDSYKLRKVEVTKGVEKNGLTEVTGEGIDEGDVIMLSPAQCSENEITNISLGG